MSSDNEALKEKTVKRMRKEIDSSSEESDEEGDDEGGEEEGWWEEGGGRGLAQEVPGNRNCTLSPDASTHSTNIYIGVAWLFDFIFSEPPKRSRGLLL